MKIIIVITCNKSNNNWWPFELIGKRVELRGVYNVYNIPNHGKCELVTRYLYNFEVVLTQI